MVFYDIYNECYYEGNSLPPQYGTSYITTSPNNLTYWMYPDSAGMSYQDLGLPSYAIDNYLGEIAEPYLVFNSADTLYAGRNEGGEIINTTITNMPRHIPPGHTPENDTPPELGVAIRMVYPSITEYSDTAQRRTQGTKPVEPEISRDSRGYANPELVYERLLDVSRKLGTHDLERICFPSSQQSKENDGGQIECRIMASVSYNGRAIWEPSDQPCRCVLGNIDNYRKHILQQHLGCSRQNGKTQRRVIEERLEAVRSGS